MSVCYAFPYAWRNQFFINRGILAIISYATYVGSPFRQSKLQCNEGQVDYIVGSYLGTNSAYGIEKLISLVAFVSCVTTANGWVEASSCSSLFFVTYRRRLFFLVRTFRKDRGEQSE